jgi:hypothetical protein
MGEQYVYPYCKNFDRKLRWRGGSRGRENPVMDSCSGSLVTVFHSRAFRGDPALMGGEEVLLVVCTNGVEWNSEQEVCRWNGRMEEWRNGGSS